MKHKQNKAQKKKQKKKKKTWRNTNRTDRLGNAEFTVVVKREKPIRGDCGGGQSSC